MQWLVPGIHVAPALDAFSACPYARYAEEVDGRDEPGHDGGRR